MKFLTALRTETQATDGVRDRSASDPKASQEEP